MYVFVKIFFLLFLEALYDFFKLLATLDYSVCYKEK